MGVPAYFSVLCKKYRGILGSVTPQCDVFYLDFNGVIHQAAYAVIEEAQKLGKQVVDDDILRATWRYFLNLVDIVKPTQAVYVYIDGCAPLAKQVQQRRRRFLSMHGIDTSTILWDRNAITPGTTFMTKLNTFLQKEAVTYKETHSHSILVSGSDEPGEGEHKLFDKIRDRNRQERSESSIIYGLDADLIMLSLLSRVPKISLMRELDGGFQYLTIDALSKCITEEHPYIDVESYIILCFLLGNDFIPNIACLQMKRGGMDIILKAYHDVTLKMRGTETDGATFSLFDNNTINYDGLQLVVSEIAQMEDQLLRDANEDYIKRIPQGSYGNTRETIAKDHYYPLLPENKSPLAKLIQQADISKWRGLYYKHLFFTNLHDSRIILSSCKLYIEGIKWVFNYYRGRAKDEEWYYPYDYAPTLKDLNNNWEVPVKHTKVAPPTDTNRQLLAVLPPESVALLPEHLRPYMTDVSMGHLHMYPRRFKLQTYLKTMKHECCPVLPACTF